ncbi:MAG TPA: hypothetical protein VFS19_06915, partial [Planctomycetota bacterium]|nr:hypothetical protein [Planctomycetota bacterium]
DAFYERSEKTIKDSKDNLDFPVGGYRRIEFYGSDVTEAELAEFKKELAAAKTAWPKVKADLEAAKAKK